MIQKYQSNLGYFINTDINCNRKAPFYALALLKEIQYTKGFKVYQRQVCSIIQKKKCISIYLLRLFL